eukprot:201751_1
MVGRGCSTPMISGPTQSNLPTIPRIHFKNQQNIGFESFLSLKTKKSKSIFHLSLYRAGTWLNLEGIGIFGRRENSVQAAILQCLQYSTYLCQDGIYSLDLSLHILDEVAIRKLILSCVVLQSQTYHSCGRVTI